VQIQPRDFRFHVYAPGNEPMDFETLEEAISVAKNFAEISANEKVTEAGGVDIRTLTEVEIKKVRAGTGSPKEIVNWAMVRVRAIGKPYLEKLNAKS